MIVSIPLLYQVIRCNTLSQPLYFTIESELLSSLVDTASNDGF
jgi:hypothetical protein